MATVVIVVWTHNLALGVLAGVLLSGLFFASKIAQIFRVTSALSADGGTRTYRVEGQVFFASADRFVDSFDTREAIDRVVIDVSGAHIWDLTGVGALDKVALRFRKAGTEVETVGLNEASRTLVDKLTIQNRADALELTGGH